jgi:hypothetical protein
MALDYELEFRNAASMGLLDSHDGIDAKQDLQ